MGPQPAEAVTVEGIALVLVDTADDADCVPRAVIDLTLTTFLCALGIPGEGTDAGDAMKGFGTAAVCFAPPEVAPSLDG